MNDKMNDLERDKAILERRNTELQAVARRNTELKEAVMTLVNFAVKGEDSDLRSGLDDLRSDLYDLRSDLNDLRSDLDDLRSDLDEGSAEISETSSTLDGVVRALRDAAAELASV